MKLSIPAIIISLLVSVGMAAPVQVDKRLEGSTLLGAAAGGGLVKPIVEGLKVGGEPVDKLMG